MIVYSDILRKVLAHETCVLLYFWAFIFQYVSYVLFLWCHDIGNSIGFVVVKFTGCIDHLLTKKVILQMALMIEK